MQREIDEKNELKIKQDNLEARLARAINPLFKEPRLIAVTNIGVNFLELLGGESRDVWMTEGFPCYIINFIS